MHVYIFRGVGRVFGVLAANDVTRLPAVYGPWTAFKEIDLQRGVATPGLNVDECLDDLEKHGMHLTDAHVRITEKHV
jgi:hypothetical protein